MRTKSAVRTTPPCSVRSDSPQWDWAQLLGYCHAVARRHTSHADVAEDAAQEAIVRAWRSSGSCRRRSDPRPWLAAIVRREVLRLLAKRAAHGEVSVDKLPEVATECAGLAGVDDRQTLEAALATLVPADRRMLILRYADDMTQPAIARALDVPEGTVKVRLHRARARLRGTIGSPSGAAAKQTRAVGIRVP